MKPLAVKFQMTAEHKDKHNGNEVKNQAVNGSFKLSRYTPTAVDLALARMHLAM
ncbi:hypothetical protein Ancab_013134, partial [Ancistrocladus abbreviatus]